MCFWQSLYIDNGVFVEGDFSITRERMVNFELVFIIVVICYILAPTPSVSSCGTVLTELSGVQVPPLHVQITPFVASTHFVLECGFSIVSWFLILTVSAVVADVDSM